MPGGRIDHVTSMSEVQRHIERAKGGLVVIDHHATWCQPCHAIAPFYDEMSRKYTGVTFLKCDVDASPEVAKVYSVRAMPTFIFLKNGSKVQEIKGADRNGIETAIKKHSGAQGSTAGHSWGSGNSLGDGSANRPIPRPEQLVERAKRLDPQLQMLVILVLVYAFYLYLGA